MSNEKSKTIVENIEMASGQLVDKVKELFEEGNARKVIIRNSDGNELMTIPLTLGIVGGGLLAAWLPVLAAVGALAAVVTKVKLEVIREVDADTVVESDDSSSEDSSESA